MSVVASRTMATWPFQNTRSPRRAPARSDVSGSGVPSAPSCMSLSRGQAMPQAMSGNLHERRAVEAKTGLAAPEIRHAEEFFGDRDHVGLDDGNGRKMTRRHVAAGDGHCERLIDARNREPGAER